MTLGSIFSQEDVRFGHPIFFIILADIIACWPDSYENNYLSLQKKSV